MAGNLQTAVLVTGLRDLNQRVETLLHLQREANQHAITMVNTQLRTNQLLEALVTQGSIPRRPQDAQQQPE